MYGWNASGYFTFEWNSQKAHPNLDFLYFPLHGAWNVQKYNSSYLYICFPIWLNNSLSAGNYLLWSHCTIYNLSLYKCNKELKFLSACQATPKISFFFYSSK